MGSEGESRDIAGVGDWDGHGSLSLKGVSMAAAIHRLADHRERTNLPLQLTSFIGRTAEIEVVKDLVAQERLVTLIGAGGIGKTRLALEVARQLLDHSATAFGSLNWQG